MPFYYSLKWMDPEMRARTVPGLQRLRAQLDREMPAKTHDKTLVLGTWNIRNFDDNRFGNGFRTKEDLYYIAEIISRFDILAVQEVCEDLGPLEEVMQILGRVYDYVFTDITEGRAGNDERLGFIFDRSKVTFRGIAGEIVLPEHMEILHDEKKRQFSRTPFMCAFQSGWFRFKFSTVHIYFGDTSGPKFDRRVNEILTVAKFLADRADRDEDSHILVGDFNIEKEGSEGFNALAENGFTIVQNDLGSNRDQTKFYDQISFREREKQLRMTGAENDNGVFQFFDSIFREADFPAYRHSLIATIEDKIAKLEADIAESEGKRDRARTESSRARHEKDIRNDRESIAEWRAVIASDEKLKEYYIDDWRTFHASDHLPLWVELKIDFSEQYLEDLGAS